MSLNNRPTNAEMLDYLTLRFGSLQGLQHAVRVHRGRMKYIGSGATFMDACWYLYKQQKMLEARERFKGK